MMTARNLNYYIYKKKILAIVSRFHRIEKVLHRYKTSDFGIRRLSKPRVLYNYYGTQLLQGTIGLEIN
jgi:hypothetical protein